MIRTRRKHESLMGRFVGLKPRTGAPAEFLDESRFQTELLKEIYRSDRRQSGRDFGLIRLIFRDQDQRRIEFDPDLCEAFRYQLRITDSIGYYDSSVAFLLPETNKEDALQVANSIADIAFHSNMSVDTEVSVYPWDDQLIVMANELRNFSAPDHHDSDGPDVPVGPNGRSAPGSVDNGSAPRGLIGNPLGKTVQCERMAGNVSQAKHSFVRSQSTPWWKRTVDILCSCLGLLVLAPVFILAAAAIKLTSPGPVFFRQMREGKNGKQFGILKFRTMHVGAENQQAELREHSEQDGPAFKLTNDPRVTPVGKYLRKSCVDELPQLINVLIGEMSLVGPRPLPLAESYACQSWQRARLTVLPGLTCTWQARAGRDVSFAQWMQMDLDYIQRRSFWFDLRLIVETAAIAVMHRGSV